MLVVICCRSIVVDINVSCQLSLTDPIITDMRRSICITKPWPTDVSFWGYRVISLWVVFHYRSCFPNSDTYVFKKNFTHDSTSLTRSFLLFLHTKHTHSSFTTYTPSANLQPPTNGFAKHAMCNEIFLMFTVQDQSKVIGGGNTSDCLLLLVQRNTGTRNKK